MMKDIFQEHVPGMLLYQLFERQNENYKKARQLRIGNYSRFPLINLHCDNNNVESLDDSLFTLINFLIESMSLGNIKS